MNKATKKAYNILNGIQTAADLKRNKLTLAAYQAAQDVYNEIYAEGKARTFFQEVADLFKKAGFSCREINGQYELYIGRR